MFCVCIYFQHIFEMDCFIAATEDEQTNINQIEISSLEENIDDKAFVQNEATQTLDQIETDNISEQVSNSSSHIENPNETSVRRLSLFDTLSTENKSAIEKLKQMQSKLSEKINSEEEEELYAD